MVAVMIARTVDFEHIVPVAVVAVTTIFKLSVGQLMPFLPDALKDVNIGFVALAVNLVVFVVVSAVTQPQAETDQSRVQTH